MKAKKALGMALALASALFFVACSNMDSGSVDNGAAFLYNAQRTLNVTVDNVQLSDGSGSAVYDPWIQKTVLPENAYDQTTLTFVLKAISNGKEESFYKLENPTAITDPSDAHNGQVKFNAVTLTAASYDFWLYAYVTAHLGTLTDAQAIYQASDVYSNTPTVTTAFWAHGSADLTNGSGEVSFKLTPFDLKGNGHIKIAGAYVDKDGTVDRIKVGVYNIYTNKEILAPLDYSVTAPTATPFVGYFGASSSATGTLDDASNPTSVTMDDSALTNFEVPAGSYRVAVTFFQGSTEVGYWSDFVVVEPDNDSKKNNIFFKGIKTIPDAPDGLTASLVQGSFAPGKPTYDVILDWKDNADNEKGYLVRVSEFTVNFEAGTQSKSTPKVYGFVAGSVKSVPTNLTVLSLLGSEYYTQTATPTTNLLLSQCKAVKLTLKTGYLYDFEVCAYNAIGTSRYSATQATAEGFANLAAVQTCYAIDPAATDFDGWTPRAAEISSAAVGSTAFAARTQTDFASDKTMVYKMATPAAAEAATFTKDATAIPSATPDKNVDYYTLDGSTYKIAYVQEFASGTDYYKLDSGKGTPYTPYHVNLYSIRYDLEYGLYYTGSTNVSNGSIYNFYRFGNDAPSFSQAFGTVAATAMSATDPLQNPLVNPATAPTPGDAKGNTTPFILKWNDDESAYYNWTTWYRQSSTANGSTKDYTSITGAPVPADPLELTKNDHAYGNQVVYAGYSGSSSGFTVYITIDSAANSAYELKDTYVKAMASNTKGSTTGDDAKTTTIDVSTKYWLNIKVDTTGASPAFNYTALRYEIGGKVQSATVNSETGVCNIDLRNWVGKGSPLPILVGGYYGGRWYSYSFNVNMSQSGN